MSRGQPKESALFKKILLSVGAAVTLTLTGCSSPAEDTAAPTTTASDATITVTDNMGREVTIPEQVNRVVAVGSMGPRIAAYMDLVDMLVGSEQTDQSGPRATYDYSNVYADKLGKLPVIGKGGGSGENNAFPEEILTANPDVILAGFNAEAADELQKQTGIPVVSIRYLSKGFIDDDFATTLEMVGKVTGKEDRAKEINDYIATAKKDLKDRVAGVAEEDKQKVYTGAVTFNGAHGFAYTYVDFPAFDAIDAHNVADVLKETQTFENGRNGAEVDWEVIPEWDPDVIFLDPGNLDLVRDEYKLRPDYFNGLRAVQNGQVYTMPATNAAGPNITYLLINAYHAGKVLYPEQFADIDLEEKAEEIMQVMLGKSFFDEMEAGGLYYGKIDLSDQANG